MKILNQYFQSYANYFWEWDISSYKPGEVYYIASMTQGDSVGYLDQFIDIIKVLSPNGIPSFGSLFLVVMATNTAIDEENYYKAINTLKNEAGDPEAFNGQYIKEGIELLQLLRTLPDSFKVEEQKKYLYQALFHNCHNRLSSKKTTVLLKEFKQQNDSEFGNFSKKKPLRNLVVQNDFKTLALLSKKFKSHDDISKAILNIPEVEEETEIAVEEPIALEDLPLTEQLLNHKEGYHIGSLLSYIWSGLQLPMQEAIPGKQPMGGVADLTNKGPLDRLLISEFANDDQVLLSRLVNGEALYIEREVPPEKNNQQYTFLIDGSIKNWGITKLLSFAIATAIKLHPKNIKQCNAFVLGDTSQECTFESTASILKGMGIVYSTIDCASGIDTYFNNQHEGDSEVFFITSEAAAKAPKQQSAIQQHIDDIHYFINVNEAGEIQLFKHQNKRKKLQQELILPYRTLWEKYSPNNKIQPKKRSKPKAQHFKSKNLMLFPISKSDCKILPHSTETFVIQKNNLYRFNNHDCNKGLALVCENIPPFITYASQTPVIFKNNKDELTIVSFDHHYHTIHRYNCTTKTQKSEPLNSFKNHNSKLFTYVNQVYLTDLEGNYWLIKHNLAVDKLSNIDGVLKKQDHYDKSVINIQEGLKRLKNAHNILSNINSVGINRYGNIVLNQFEIDDYKLTKNYGLTGYSFNRLVDLYLKRKAHNNTLAVVKAIKTELNCSLKTANELANNEEQVIMEKAPIAQVLEFKKQLEDLGATCYHKPVSFTSNDGSIIYENKGFLHCVSSNHEILPFAISTVIDFPIAMATKNYFAGNDYFLPPHSDANKISIADFKSEFIQPFIDHILNHEA